MNTHAELARLQVVEERRKTPWPYVILICPACCHTFCAERDFAERRCPRCRGTYERSQWRWLDCDLCDYVLPLLDQFAQKDPHSWVCSTSKDALEAARAEVLRLAGRSLEDSP